MRKLLLTFLLVFSSIAIQAVNQIGPSGFSTEVPFVLLGLPSDPQNIVIQ